MLRKMKDSGIEWIGEIPKDWENVKFKYIYTSQKAKLPKELFDDATLTPYMSIDYIRNSKIQPMYAKEGDFCSENDTLLIWDGSNSGEFIIEHPEGYAPSTTAIIRIKSNKINKKFGDYFLKSLEKELRNNTNGMGIPHVNGEFLRNSYICIPKLDEQHRIANFLDEKVGELNSTIDKTKATIEELKKYKQSVITEVVTKGLNSEVEMKDSGIEWIEEIPEHWKINRLKNKFSFNKGLSITKENLQETGISVISYGQIHSKINNGLSILDDLIRYVSDEYLELNKQSLVNKGDFIFADTSEDLSGCGNCVYSEKQMQLFGGYHTILLKSNENKENKYLAYLFLTDCWRSQIRCRVSGIKLFSITQKILKETTIIIPPISEQLEIVTYLDEKCSEIDNLITNYESLITELEIYKKSLIYEYVTGKKEVI
ncbi:restriction endonuclease subunit S [Terrisporobacter sp.]